MQRRVANRKIGGTRHRGRPQIKLELKVKDDKKFLGNGKNWFGPPTQQGKSSFVKCLPLIQKSIQKFENGLNEWGVKIVVLQPPPASNNPETSSVSF